MSDAITIQISLKELNHLRAACTSYVRSCRRGAEFAASEGRPEAMQRLTDIEDLNVKLGTMTPVGVSALVLTNSKGRVVFEAFTDSDGFYRHESEGYRGYGRKEDILRTASAILMDNPSAKPSGALAIEYTVYARDVMGLKP